jgi:subtilisin family serine protease
MPASKRRASKLVLPLIAVLLGSVMATGVSAAGPGDPAAAHGRYIVRARSHADVAGLRQTARTAGAKVVNELSATDTLVVTGSKAAAAALSRDSGAVTVVPDRIEQIVPPEWSGANKIHKPQGDGGGHHKPAVNPDPAFDLSGLMWDYDRIDAQKAWKTTTGRPSVLVGVADTGLDYTHSELATKIVGNVNLADPTLCYDYFGGMTDADFAALYGGPADTDWNGHGSWIGGDIAGALDGVGINGIAPSIGLVALKISEWCGSAYDSSILDAFQYAADNGIDVVSISFGGYLDRSDPDQEAIYQAYVDTVAYARSKGTVIVAASGNEHLRLGAEGRVISHGPLTIPGDPFQDYYGLYENPGGVPGVVAVSATGNVVKGASDTCATGTFETSDATCKPKSDAHQPTGVGRQNQLTYYSNYGPRIDVAAPGGARKFNVPSADRGGTGGFPYTTADGYTAFETFSITSNWALEIPCFVNLGPQFYQNECYSTIQGTSMATPHASAVVALIASAHPWMRHHPALLVGWLKVTAENIHGNTTPGLSATDTSAGDRTGLACPTGYCHLGGPAISDRDAYGAGLVNAAAAVR